VVTVKSLDEVLARCKRQQMLGGRTTLPSSRCSTCQITPSTRRAIIASVTLRCSLLYNVSGTVDSHYDPRLHCH
jgi:hypothetical protein